MPTCFGGARAARSHARSPPDSSHRLGTGAGTPAGRSLGSFTPAGTLPVAAHRMPLVIQVWKFGSVQRLEALWQTTSPLPPLTALRNASLLATDQRVSSAPFGVSL